jgi:hypothetical protein
MGAPVARTGPAVVGAVRPLRTTEKGTCGSITSGLRHSLHLQSTWHATAGVVYHVRPATAAFSLSPFVAPVAPPCRPSAALEPLVEQALGALPAGWHRFCLLPKGSKARGRGHGGRAPGRVSGASPRTPPGRDAAATSGRTGNPLMRRSAHVTVLDTHGTGPGIDRHPG